VENLQTRNNVLIILQTPPLNITCVPTINAIFSLLCRKMKFLIFLAICVAGSQAVSFFDLVQEQWGAFKVSHFCIFLGIFRSLFVDNYSLYLFIASSNNVSWSCDGYSKYSV
jgi:hypothetical protein